MANSSKLPSIAGLAVAGAALGLYLGSSAISEINPAYYSTPVSASTFHADLVPNAPEREGDQALPELTEVASEVASGCTWCSSVPEDAAGVEYSAFDSYSGSPSSYRAIAADAVIAEADRHVSRGLSEGELRDIERYAHFRVSEDEDRLRLAAFAAGAETDDAGCGTDEACEGETAPGI